MGTSSQNSLETKFQPMSQVVGTKCMYPFQQIFGEELVQTITQRYMLLILSITFNLENQGIAH